MKFAFDNETKGIQDFQGDWFLNFIFCSYASMSLTCSCSFSRGVARGGLHFFYNLFVVKYPIMQ